MAETNSQTVDECIVSYMKLSREVFNIDQVLFGAIPAGDNRCRFDYKILENAIKDIVKDRLGFETCAMSEALKSPYCRTFVVAKKALHTDGPPTIFRSYYGDGIRPSKCAIWQAALLWINITPLFCVYKAPLAPSIVNGIIPHTSCTCPSQQARATSAAPSFFKEMYIDNPRPGVQYVDGGLGHNNPAEIALDEAGRIWPKSKHFCLVSLGTGRQRAVKIIESSVDPVDDINSQRTLFEQVRSFVPQLVSFVPGWKTANHFPSGVLALIKMASTMSSLIMDSEGVHQRLQRDSRATDINKQFPYFRFNVERDIGDIGFGDWSTQERVRVHTDSYMQEQEAEERKATCVNYLMSSSNVGDDVTSSLEGNT